MVQLFVVTRSCETSLRRKIITASLELGTAAGEEGVTMRGIASKLGVSATALYQHFEGKAAILREIRLYGVDQLWAALAPAREIEDPRGRAVGMGERYVEFAISNPWLYVVLTQHDQIDWAQLDPEEVLRMTRPLVLVRETLADGKERGMWADLDVELGAFRMWAAMHGMCSLMISGRISEQHPVFPVRDKSAYVRQFIESLVAGLGPT